MWLVPAVGVAGAAGLAVVLVPVDAGLRPSGGVLLFPGPPSGARSFLSAIVQAMISFTAVVFSITVVVLQRSSSQYSPRVLRAVPGGSGAGQAGFVPRLLFQAQGRPGRQDGGDRGHDDERQWRAALFRHVAFDTERTMEQDAASGFRQLADIALQALSPVVNAPPRPRRSSTSCTTCCAAW